MYDFSKKKNIGEMDFVIEMNGKVVPIEVKSGKAYKSHKALDNFMNIQDYHLEKAYVFSVGNVETEGTVTYLPIYMCYLLKEQKLGQMIVELDTTGLQIKKVIIIIDEYDVLLGYKKDRKKVIGEKI